MKDTSAPVPASLATGAILVALVALGQVSTSLYVPSLPAIGADFSESTESVSLTFTVFLAAFAFAQLGYGPLSDRFGRRRVLLGGIVLYVAASIVCTAAPNLETLIAARFVQAFGACAGPVLGRAMVRDIYGRDQVAKVMAYIGMAFAVSPAITPIIGGILQVHFGWRANFLFLTLFGAVMLAIVAFRLGETYRPEAGLGWAGMLRNYRLLLAHRGVMGYSISAACVFAGLMVFVSAAPFVFIERLGVSPDLFGVLIIFNTAGVVAGNFAVTCCARRLSPDRMIAGGIAVAVVAALVLVAFAVAGWMNVAVIIAPMTVYMFGMGVVFPNAQAGALAPYPQAAGSASALSGFFQMGVAALASRAAGLVPHQTQLPMALVILACAVIAAASFALLVRPRPATDGSDD